VLTAHKLAKEKEVYNFVPLGEGSESEDEKSESSLKPAKKRTKLDSSAREQNNEVILQLQDELAESKALIFRLRAEADLFRAHIAVLEKSNFRLKTEITSLKSVDKENEPVGRDKKFVEPRVEH